MATVPVDGYPKTFCPKVPVLDEAKRGEVYPYPGRRSRSKAYAACCAKVSERDKALALGVPIVDEEQLIAWLHDRGDGASAPGAG
jgi:hypothetical protein